MEKYIVIPIEKKNALEALNKNNEAMKCLVTKGGLFVLPMAVLDDFQEYFNWDYETIELDKTDLEDYNTHPA